MALPMSSVLARILNSAREGSAMKRAIAIASGIAAAALVTFAAGAAAQQTQSGARLPQLRFNAAAMPVKPAQPRSTVYTLGRLQHFQMGINNVRAMDRTQIVTPPAPVSSRLSR
jgi:hypothetical protein